MSQATSAAAAASAVDEETSQALLSPPVGIIKSPRPAGARAGASTPKKNVSFSDDLEINQYYDETRASLGYKWINYRHNLMRSKKMQLLHKSSSSFSRQSEGVFCSYQFHIVVIICVILSLLCVTGELLIMSIELTAQNDMMRYAQTHSTRPAATQPPQPPPPGPFNAPQGPFNNAPFLSAPLSPGELSGIKKLLFNLSVPAAIVAERPPELPLMSSTGAGSNLQPASASGSRTGSSGVGGEAAATQQPPTSTQVLRVLAKIFKYMGLTIVGMFATEYLIKSISYPRIFLKYKMEIVELAVTVVSFVFDIVLIERKHVVHSIAPILVVLRLWRFIKLINKIEELTTVVHEEFEASLDRINQLDAARPAKNLRKLEPV